MHDEWDKSMLYRTVIEREIVLDQVWNIYNESVPLSIEKYQKSGEYIDLLIYDNEEKRDCFGFNLDYNENQSKEKYKQGKESEGQAFLRYKEFKTHRSKDLKAVLKMMNSPLVHYADTKRKKIPVIVAAVFTAIYDLRKYGTLTPKKMIELSEGEHIEEIEMFLFHEKYDVVDNSNYFIMRLVENLKYFFNIAPQLNETNLGIVREFDYELIKDGSHYLIQRKSKTEETDGRNDANFFDKDNISKEIDEFIELYLQKVNSRQNETQRFWEIMIAAEELLNKYPYEDTHEVIQKLEEMKQVLNFKNEKIRVAVLLDFTEEPFSVVHDLLGKSNRDKFYKKNIEMKEKSSELGKLAAGTIKDLEKIRKKMNNEFGEIINSIARMS